MKRTGNLYEKISDTENLLLAYYKAKKSKEAKKEVIQFSKDVKNNIAHLQKEIVAENVKVGDYHYFTIYDPKQRVICAASFRERILHHAIMNVCHQVFENFQIFDSYATRPNKGQYAALERAKRFNNQHQWFCKLDIRKYFDSISHQILLTKLQHKIKGSMPMGSNRIHPVKSAMRKATPYLTGLTAAAAGTTTPETAGCRTATTTTPTTATTT